MTPWFRCRPRRARFAWVADTFWPFAIAVGLAVVIWLLSGKPVLIYLFH